MSKEIRWLLVISGSAFSFVFAFTAPTVYLYFAQHVSPQIYATSELIETVLAAIMVSAMGKESIRNKMRRIFVFVLILDSIGYVIISMLSLDSVTIRYIGLAILSAITVNIWATLMIDVVNGALSGSKLTDYQMLLNSGRLWGTVIGSGLAVLLTGVISLENAIWLQCGANAITAICDYKGFNSMT